jgi:hypothetical protein
MPLKLDHFLNAAENHTTSEVYVTGDQHQAVAQTRGSFYSWIVSVFKGAQTRTERAETTEAFVRALQEKISEKTGELRGARQELREQYDEDTDQIVKSLKKILSNQLTGQRALTANVIRIATDFVDSTLAVADLEKENLNASLNRDETLQKLNTTALQFYGRQFIEDVNLTDAQAAANFEAVRGQQEVEMAIQGLHVISRTPPPATPDTLAHLLRGYLTGNPIQMDYETASAKLTQLRKDITDIRYSAGEAIPFLENLVAGNTVRENAWTREIEPGSEEARFYLQSFKTLKDEYLGPMRTLEYFLRADVADMMRTRFLAAKAVTSNGGDTVTSQRSVSDILDDFLAGQKLSEQDTAFIRTALNSKEITQIDRTRPGYRVSSSGGNPNSSIEELLDATVLVPNHIWQVVTDQQVPDRSQLVFDPSEPNPWALAVNNSVMNRCDGVLEFFHAQNDLKDLLESVATSGGDPVEAQRLYDEAEVRPKSKKQWSGAAREINMATLRNANEINNLEQATEGLEDRFERGLNRAIIIDPNATPDRPDPKSPRDYTHGYDDDPDSGRYEASHLRAPKVAQAAAPTAASLEVPQAQDTRVVRSDVKDLSVIDIDLDIERTPRGVFNEWLAQKIQTTPLESLWSVLPTLARNGHAARVVPIEIAIKNILVSQALTPVRESLKLTQVDFDQLVEKISARVDASFQVGSDDEYAKISFERLRLRIQEYISRVASGYSVRDLL